MLANMFAEISLKYKIIIVFVFMVIILTCISIARRQLTQEGFISQPNAIDEIEYRGTMWPTDDNTGLKPIVLRNTKSFPTIQLIHVNQQQYGGINSNVLGPVLEVMRSRIYPFTLQTGLDINRCLDLLIDASLNQDNMAIKFAILRENAIIESHNISVDNENINANNDNNNKIGKSIIKVWCPMYHDIFMALGNRQSFIKNMQQLRDISPDGTKFRVAVAIADLPYFQLICRNLNIPWKPDTRQFTLLLIGVNEYNTVESEENILNDINNSDSSSASASSGYDTLDMALNGMANMKLDMIFVICHPKNTSIQKHIIDSPTRLIDIYPPSAIPEDASQNNPYEAGETNLISKFVRDMRRDIPWLFVENMDKSRLPVVTYESQNSNPIANQASESLHYKTFRIRNLLVSSWHVGTNTHNRTDITNSIDTYPNNIITGDNYGDGKHKIYLDVVNDIAARMVKYYQTLGATVIEWNADPSIIQSSSQVTRDIIQEKRKEIEDNTDLNRGEQKTRKRQNMVGRLISYNPEDGDSFEFEAIGAIPKELDIEPVFKNVLLGNNLMKSETIYSCRI